MKTDLRVGEGAEEHERYQSLRMKEKKCPKSQFFSIAKQKENVGQDLARKEQAKLNILSKDIIPLFLTTILATRSQNSSSSAFPLRPNYFHRHQHRIST